MSTGKIIGGVLIGVGAIAAAPFTGGGSLFAAGVSLSAALSGTAVAAAVGAGAAGAAAGAAMGAKEAKDRRQEGENKFKEGATAGENEVKRKFAAILKTQLERDQFTLIALKIGVYVSNVDGTIDESEEEELEKLVFLINDNPATPEVIKKEVQKVLNENISLSELQNSVEVFLSDKQPEVQMEMQNIFLKLIQRIIESDGHIHSKESEFLTDWKKIQF